MVAGLAMAAFGSPAETELKALEQQWLDAYVKADTALLKTVEADEWWFVESDGTIMTKAQDIKDVGDKTFVCKSATMSDVNVRMLGDDFACVTGMAKMTGSFKGKEFTGDFRAIDIFEKKNDKWQAITSQVTRVKKEKE